MSTAKKEIKVTVKGMKIKVFEGTMNGNRRDWVTMEDEHGFEIGDWMTRSVAKRLGEALIKMSHQEIK